MSEESISFAGDVQVDNVTIISSNGSVLTVLGQVIGIEIFEDVFSPFITGRLMLKDAQELTNYFPLVGEEIVQIAFKTPAFDYKYAYAGEFYIYKYDSRVRISEREVAYVLHFISKEAVVDLNKKISKTFSGKLSDIARKLITEEDGLDTPKPVNIEDTSNSTKYISNFWSPIRNLNYITESSTNANGSPSYVFFENKYGFNFVSLESLYAENPVYQTFQWDNYNVDINPTGGSKRDIGKDYARITEIRAQDVYNYIDRISSGLYGSQMTYYDLTTKKYAHIPYEPKFQDDKHLNNYPLSSDKLVSRTQAVMIHEHKYLNNFQGYGDVTNTKFVQRRLALLAATNAFKVEITVPGRTDYSAGQKMFLSIPMHAQLKESTTNEDFIDKVYTGTYLVTAICHRIMRDKHECVMELIKDSHIIDLNSK